MNVLIIDDEVNIRESLKKYLALDGINAVTAADGSAAIKLLVDETFDAIVLDLRLPGMTGQEILEWMQSRGIRSPVIMISAHGEIADAVSALKTGAADYLTKPFDPEELVYRLKSLVANRRSEDILEAGKRTSEAGTRLVGDSPAMRELSAQIGRIADSDATVLVTGESGTGKEVVARELHTRGAHAEEPFVAVNIGGIHESLMESELFGHEKGSFTGATARKIGLFELAGNGTLFLDEIGEMPPNLQVKLLRVLQDRKIRRLGGNVDLPVRARIVSATNRDIEAMVRAGTFREDLYYRLNVVRLKIPPLRERSCDIPEIAAFLLGKIAARMNRPARPISSDAMSALVSYPFPGNVRELENILERALIYCRGGQITLPDIDLRDGDFVPDIADPPEPQSARDAPSRGAQNISMSSLERDAIAAALARHGGNRTHAAEELGISRRTIINKIRSYGLE
jgi:two-component system, NtrC family, response regulator AtoC